MQWSSYYFILQNVSVDTHDRTLTQPCSAPALDRRSSSPLLRQQSLLYNGLVVPDGNGF